MDLIRKLILKVIGYPKQYQDLIKHLEDLPEESIGIAMYPVGEFPVGINIPEVGPQTYSFITNAERKAFLTGMKLGTHLLGGHVQAIGFDSQEEFDEMMKESNQMPRKDRMN